jgi:hypothetical protein
MNEWQVPARSPLHVVATAVAGPWSHERRFLLDLHTPAAADRLAATEDVIVCSFPPAAAP